LFNKCLSDIGRADKIVFNQTLAAMKAIRPYDSRDVEIHSSSYSSTYFVVFCLFVVRNNTRLHTQSGVCSCMSSYVPPLCVVYVYVVCYLVSIYHCTRDHAYHCTVYKLTQPPTVCFI
jgi:hypothetical protein